ncbi:septum formation initiator family protein [Patescibacteria group bacterium]|nr:septum formation initiator family protein [Patescibacteria group bacterium]
MVTNHHNYKISKILLSMGFVIVAYMIYTLTNSVYTSYLLDRHIDSFKNKNEEITAEYQSNLDDLNYFESDAYAEKIAKEQFGLIRPGEEVIVLLDEEVVSETEVSIKEADSIKKYRRLSTPGKWWYYFFEI